MQAPASRQPGRRCIDDTPPLVPTFSLLPERLSDLPRYSCFRRPVDDFQPVRTPSLVPANTIELKRAIGRRLPAGHSELFPPASGFLLAFLRRRGLRAGAGALATRVSSSAGTVVSIGSVILSSS